jgi:hypothetical protein
MAGFGAAHLIDPPFAESPSRDRPRSGDYDVGIVASFK